MKVDVIKGDITKMKIEAIVSPANSYLTMGIDFQFPTFFLSF